MATYGIKTSPTFQRRLTVGFTATLAVTAFIAVASTFLLHDVINQKDLVIYDYGQDLILTERLRYLGEKKVAMFRGYYITRDKVYLDDIGKETDQFHDIIQQLYHTASPLEAKGLDELVELFRKYDETNAHVLERLQRHNTPRALLEDLVKNVRPIRQAFEAKMSELVAADSDKLDRAKRASMRVSQRSSVLIAVIAATALGLAAILAFVLGRTLNELYQSALRATRLREEVLGIVAHDLKNPIMAIQMNSRLLMRAAVTPNGAGKMAPVMDRIDRATHQMQRLIDDLLIADKIESGIFTLDLKKESLSQLINDAAESARAQAQESGVKFETRFSPNLGDITCDRDRLMQVFSNLLGNAIKFTPLGGQVIFEVTAFRGDILLIVKDTGPGITSSQMPLLFERRWQAQSTSKMGNGLGLFIAKSIVKAHRGEITVESHPGHGSAFRVEIPRQLVGAFKVNEGQVDFI
jgi:signal transduction histidine kinase